MMNSNCHNSNVVAFQNSEFKFRYILWDLWFMLRQIVCWVHCFPVRLPLLFLRIRETIRRRGALSLLGNLHNLAVRRSVVIPEAFCGIWNGLLFQNYCLLRRWKSLYLLKGENKKTCKKVAAYCVKLGRIMLLKIVVSMSLAVIFCSIMKLAFWFWWELLVCVFICNMTCVALWFFCYESLYIGYVHCDLLTMILLCISASLYRKTGVRETVKEGKEIEVMWKTIFWR